MYGTTLDPTARAHWGGVVESLTKKPTSEGGGGGMGGFAQFMLGNEAAELVVDDDTVTGIEQLKHLGCQNMRCRHDKYRTKRARQEHAMKRRRVLMLQEMKDTMLKGNM